ncbi:MAG TPA: hypothetical protein VJ746_20415 [Nitrospira sp.]|nr:hypothetical protein [Nitrospira sp.]
MDRRRGGRSYSWGRKGRDGGPFGWRLRARRRCRGLVYTIRIGADDQAMTGEALLVPGFRRHRGCRDPQAGHEDTKGNAPVLKSV